MTETKRNGFASFNLPAQDRLPNGSTLAIMLPQPAVDLSILDVRRITLDKEPPKPVTVYSLAGQQICTPGNLTVIAAQAKAGKTAVVGAMLAASLAVLSKDGSQGQRDLLGFTASSPGANAVVVFDTEQSPHDAWNLVHRGVCRAGITILPENFRCYALVDVSTNMRRQLLEAELKRSAAVCTGIHSVIIDGIADLCIDPNDSIEAFGLVEELVQLAVKYECSVIVVLHENPSKVDSGKTRGHLGSQLERKAESNLRVAKDGKGISTIYADRCRRASIPKDTGPRFAYDRSADMHTSLTTNAGQDKLINTHKAHQATVDEVFEGIKGDIEWTALKERIKKVTGKSESTAGRRIIEWVNLKLIATTEEGTYHRG
jgi:hypothetical protein